MISGFDDWYATDPADHEYCEDHDCARPCRICKVEAVEAQLERWREEMSNAH